MKRCAAAFVLAALTMVSGCMSRDLPLESSDAIGYAPAYGTEIAIENGDPAQDTRNGVPSIRMELITEMTASVVTLDKGTFSWDGAIACGVGPLECYEDGLIHAIFDPGMLAEPPRVLLPEDAAIGFVNCWGKDGGDYIEQNVEFSADGEIFLPEEPVGPAYEVYITFGDGEYCHYMFATQHAVQDHNGDTESSVAPAEPAQQLSSPPQLKLWVDTEDISRSYTLTTGNYSWTVVHGETASEAIACGASPFQSAELGQAVKIPSSAELTRAPRLALAEGAEISEVKVWASDDSFTNAEFSDDGEIFLADAESGCVYSVVVKYPQGEAEYVFALESICGYPAVEDMSEIEYDDDGLWHPEASLNRTDDFDGWQGFVTVTSVDERFPQYGADFFAENALIALTMTESSGSISNEFLGIDESNNILIQRKVPMVGTCDMAKYELVIEIPISLAQETFSVKYVE